LIHGFSEDKETLECVHELETIYDYLEMAIQGRLSRPMSGESRLAFAMSESHNSRTRNRDRSTEINHDTWTKLQTKLLAERGCYDWDNFRIRCLRTMLLMGDYMVNYELIPSSLLGLTLFPSEALAQIVKLDLDKQTYWYTSSPLIYSHWVIPTVECLTNYKGVKRFHRSLRGQFDLFTSL
jgi:hypothetical protein